MNDRMDSGMAVRKARAAAGDGAGVQTAQAGGSLALARAFLNSGREIDASISALLAQIDQARSWAGRMEEGEPALQQMRAEALAKIARLKTRREQIGAVIDVIGDAEVRMTLKLRCLTYKTWPQIGLALELDESAAKRRFARGVRMIALAAENGLVELSPKARAADDKAVENML